MIDPGAKTPWALSIFALVLWAVGLLLAGPGLYLAVLGGSAYYALAGVLVCGAGVLVWRRSALAALVYGAVVLLTVIWAYWEVGPKVWLLVPRISGVGLLALGFTLPAIARALGLSGRTRQVMALACAGSLLALVLPFAFPASKPAAQPFASAAGGEQRGPDPLAGNHFARLDQINPANVARLKLAWQADLMATGLLKGQVAQAATLQVTPLRIGNGLYLCLGNNAVVALDADSGTQLWTFDPKVDHTGSPALVCRGLAYHAGATPGAGICAERLFMATIDDRLIALDKATGKPCPRFGSNGTVSLRANLGPVHPGYHYSTSPPAVIGNRVIVGSRVLDGRNADMPSGAVRAFDAVSGQLLWAWDTLSPKAVTALGPEAVLPRSSPNAWSLFSADPAMGLVFVPTGGVAIDHFGGNRRDGQDRYGSSIVALDAATGSVRWNFQTVHHDIWDYDVASQPALVDLPLNGQTVPALVAPTKRGQVFVLDRRTGRPLYPVDEKPVPQDGAVAGEKLAPTQPYSRFHSFAKPALTDADMWGATPFDLLACRIAFKRLNYHGEFTPPSVQGTLVYPAVTGVFNWGGVSVDLDRRILIANTNNIATVVTLIPRAQADRRGISEETGARTDSNGKGSTLFGAAYPQMGTPFAATAPVFLSPLGFPCNAPPWGELTAVSLETNKMLWTQPLGTTRDVAPLGLALPTGIMGQGGSLVTSSGLTFIGAAFESAFRAFDSQTGQLLWSAPLPAPGRATPLSYRSLKDGRQFVVVASGGTSRAGGPAKAFIVAYALDNPSRP
ncbi:membrane-bound PQQ-dependent dehydrogenase, glucose/quinate/shikimate family [Novosphingobium sp.]|uniref:membrane-bound PQQ-dependent dehydrogenase, glucose/quinate/shikimate family n=1 Tax=Novosphingobium sp. TaxID=1874826 RepID=UPI0022C20162|nr:membrane-bound PQQ-dependent dehydrogenase, glucose/quinate/shikimate family [Novosphingobium sp.]MCZ8075271.1 membrane-bound PQQ-dependent dehydrogenase, glucose/quinate/shikimate family [Roseateles sp.]MCZ8085653.1 membrane-bound PQQ-dependent dehydrogenase, glucose/quinate/shikimate family [Paracoccaceae bacterium]MCZ8255812.1 membrane-bound PQQ-dependent dehydrogenase, glucose/quinate/shikimate family [Polaromonas sp.]MCZ8036421.1 membrane-bound PQQ-dependent dehydrogenase, glucose/quina